MCPFIDIHTHQNTLVTASIWSLKNILLKREPMQLDIPISAGWHPWYIENISTNEIIAKLQEAMNKKNVMAIGECGLDRTIKTPIEVQLDVFQLHLRIAKQSGKPIIMHCVKAYSDLLEVLKKNKLSIPIILHGFNGNQLQVQQLLLQYNIFFSYGASLFKKNMKIADTVRSIPLSRLFLETDESEISIEKIYFRAAEIIYKPLEELKMQIYSNFKNVFGDGLVKQD